MNIEIKKVKDKNFTYHTGGGCAETNVFIEVDAKLPLKLQITTIFHELTEVYLPCLHHDKVIEFERLFEDCLDELEW